MKTNRGRMTSNTRDTQWTFWIALLGLTLGMSTPAATFEQNLEKTFDAAPGGKLVLDADRGSVRVSPEAAGPVKVRVLRKVDRASKSAADELFADHKVEFKQDGNTVTVVAKSKQNRGIRFGNSPWLQVHYEISVPKRFDLDLKTAGGDLRVGDLDGNVAAHTTSGSIDLADIAGKVEAANAGGNVKVQSAGRDLSARTTSGSIDVKQARARVDAQDAGGNIRISDAGGDVSARTTSGSIMLGKAGGDVTAKNAGGNITIQSAAGEVNAETTSGTIKIGTVGKGVALRNAGGGIELDRAGGPVAARTTSGNIKVGSAAEKVELKNAGGSIEVRAARGTVSANTTSGQIVVNFSAVPKSGSSLQVAGGGIRVGLPATAAINLDARAAGGSVHSELPVSVTATDSLQHGALQGPINGGGPALLLRSTSGNIEITKTAASDSAPDELEDSGKTGR